ncbi:MAG: hypothetical protein Q4F05_07990 [bacterium]|nr:hypothetical protein [bacterium]
MDEHSYLNGLWTTDNKSKDSILNHGGSYLEITVLNNNEIKGTLVSIQGGTQRIASITFTSYIKNDELIYKYDDDGFDNSGTVVMKLSKDKIIVSNNTTLADSNTSGWSINSVELTKYK